MKKFRKIAISFLTAGVLGTVLVGCSGDQTVDATGDKTIKLGINGTEFAVWDYVQAELAKEDITLEVISFSDYIQPNLALDQGEIDINSFQTQIYFEQFKEDHSLDIVPFGNTIVAPMAIYTNHLETIDTIPENGTIAIPNDLTNGGRALLLLEEVGLITVGEYEGSAPEIKDIVENPKNLDIISMAAQQIPTSLQDVDLGVINSGMAITAGLDPLTDSLYVESIESENIKQYYNIFAIREGDESREELQRLLEVYQTEAVKEIILDVYKGAQVPVFE